MNTSVMFVSLPNFQGLHSNILFLVNYEELGILNKYIANFLIFEKKGILNTISYFI